MTEQSKLPLPHPGWWKGLNGDEIAHELKRLQETSFNVQDIEFTHDLYEMYGENNPVAEVGHFEEVNLQAGLGFLRTPGSDEALYTSIDLMSSQYRLKWKRNSPHRPLPLTGWWKGLSSGEFYARLRSFGLAHYEASEFRFTHDLIRRKDGRIIGEAAEVESVEGNESQWVIEHQGNVVGLAVIRFYEGEENPLVHVCSPLNPYDYKAKN